MSVAPEVADRSKHDQAPVVRRDPHSKPQQPAIRELKGTTTMSEFNYHHAGNAAQMIDERIAVTRRSRVLGHRRRHSGRHSLANGLHSLANRLDS